jgi:antitoxin VapB
MILHVRDVETDELVRRLARSRGISITDAIREAVEQALEADERASSDLWDRTADLRVKIESYPLTGEKADKSFYDMLSGHED